VKPDRSVAFKAFPKILIVEFSEFVPNIKNSSGCSSKY